MSTTAVPASPNAMRNRRDTDVTSFPVMRVLTHKYSKNGRMS